MPDSKRLPIKVITQTRNDIEKNKGGGSTNQLGEYSEEQRAKILNDCKNLKAQYINDFIIYHGTPLIGKVIMKEKAIAKSHKPTKMFNPNTCPIVGAEKLNEILVKVTPYGLEQLIKITKCNNSKEFRANITKIESFETYKTNEKIEIKGFSRKTKINKRIKVKLFSFQDDNGYLFYEKYFEDYISEVGWAENIEKLNYGRNLSIYKVSNANVDMIIKLSEFPGVQRISYFSECVLDNPNGILANRKMKDLPLPENDKEYPIIGIVDSGISKNNKYLSPWIYKREEYVVEEYQNNSHGTFVAGIIEYGRILNGISEKQAHFKLLDIVAIPNSDPTKGLVDSLSEDSLLEILKDAFTKYCDKVKVWNLSLGTSVECGEIISDLAIRLDELQDEYGVEIIIASGNYEIPPLRPWPVSGWKGNDKITVPADSARAITVGSISNISCPGFVEKNNPSPFTRKGPGPNFLLKPELVHYGGNCNDKGICEGMGMISFDVTGNLVERVGTSFSTPFITSLYARLISEIYEDNAKEFAKAFLVHSASTAIIGEDPRIKDYVGYGIPNDNFANIISCDESEVTMVFKGKLFSGNHIEYNDFPFPKALIKNGKSFGQIKMTLVYSPKLDSAFGQEYCRVNIDAHLGTYVYKGDKGEKVVFIGRVPLEKKWSDKYERAQVGNGLKWNSVKSYFVKISPKRISGERWRLMIDATSRLNEDYNGQEFVLIITIKDPDNNDIYSEITNTLRDRGYSFDNLKLQTQIQQETKIKN